MNLIFASVAVLTLASIVKGAIYEQFEDVPGGVKFDFVIVGGKPIMVQL